MGFRNSLFSLQQELFLPPLLHKTSKKGSKGSGCGGQGPAWTCSRHQEESL